MFKFNLPPVITTALQNKYFRYYAQLSEDNTDGLNVSIISCKDIPKNSNYTAYLCLELSEVGTLFSKDSGNYNEIYIRVWQC